MVAVALCGKVIDEVRDVWCRLMPDHDGPCDGRVPSAPGCQPSASAAVPASSQSGIPSRWPSSDEVLAELRRRDDSYNNVRKLHYTPGTGEPQSVGAVADHIQATDRHLSDPVFCLVSQLGGEAFLMEDASVERINLRTGKPDDETPAQEARRKVMARRAELMRQAADMLNEYRKAELAARDFARARAAMEGK